MPGNQVRIGVGTTGANKAASDLDRVRGKFDKLRATSAKGLLVGVGAGAGLAAWNAAARAIGGVVDYLGDASEAYIEEEKSISGLNASLKASVPYWNDNTKAIERTLAARMDLGFSDDEQRESLKRLVAATHNVNDALDIQRTAMDLARFKGISLAEATEALVKVEAGSFRILKSLGIELKANATQTDALAAVQRVAAGAADAYAKTIEGKLTKAQVKMNEAQEKFGKGVAELQSHAFPLLADAVDFLATGFEHATMAEEAAAEAVRRLGRDAPFDEIKALTKELYLAALAADQFKIGMDIAGEAGSFRRAVELAGEATGRLGQKIPNRNDFGGMVDGFWDVRQAARPLVDVLDDVTGEIDDLFDAAERPGAMKAIKDRIADLKDEIRDTNDKGDIKIMKGDLIDLYEEGFALASKDGPQAGIDFLLKWRDATAKTDRKTLDLIDHLLTLARRMKALKGPFAAAAGGPGGPGGHRASGGPVEAGKAYTVGEQGPETFVAPTNGTIIPHGAPMGGGGSGGSSGGVTIIVQGVSVLTPGSAEALARQLEPVITRAQQRRGQFAGARAF